MGKTASPQPLGARDDYKLSNMNEPFIKIETSRADMNTLKLSNLIYARNKNLYAWPGGHDLSFSYQHKNIYTISLSLITFSSA